MKRYAWLLPVVLVAGLCGESRLAVVVGAAVARRRMCRRTGSR
jgi:hypothetical protein